MIKNNFYNKINTLVKTKFKFFVFIIIFVSGIVTFSVNAALTFDHLGGYAWSDTIGWVSMSCKTGGPTGNDICASNNYEVVINQTTKVLSGHAWSDNIGWVSFNSADVSGCPSAPCTPTLTGTGLSGFAKALSGGTAESGGWDGYIDLSSVGLNGVTGFSGYAWGSDVIGWLDMSGVVYVYPSATVTLNAIPNHVSYGKKSVVYSTTTNATACDINGNPPWPNNPGLLPASTDTEDLIVTTNYALTCVGLGSPLPGVTATTTVNVCPQATPIWNGSSCVDGPENITTIEGQYTPTGDLKVTCTNSTSYTVTKGGLPFTSGTIPTLAQTTITIPITIAGNYQSFCIRTDANTKDTSDPSIILPYYTTPPTPIVSLKASPTTMSANSPTVLSWTIAYPGSIQSPERTCTLTAKPVCSNGVCNPAQLVASTTINTAIQTESTDTNDQSGSRPISPTALNVVTDIPNWKTSGKKTFILDKSMDFKIDCGSEPNASQGVRILVTSSTEG